MQSINRARPTSVLSKDTVLITPYRDGPLIVRGAFRLLDAIGAPIENRRQAVALCRCGKSRAKPFCDGTHKKIDKKIAFTTGP